MVRLSQLGLAPVAAEAEEERLTRLPSEAVVAVGERRKTRRRWKQLQHGETSGPEEGEALCVCW